MEATVDELCRRVTCAGSAGARFWGLVTAILAVQKNHCPQGAEPRGHFSWTPRKTVLLERGKRCVHIYIIDK
jgi:hypothetical protein